MGTAAPGFASLNAGLRIDPGYAALHPPARVIIASAMKIKRVTAHPLVSPLATPFGVMEGTYQMVSRNGEQFDAKVAPFTLSEPYTVH